MDQNKAAIDPINLAREKMGEGRRDDYILAPTSHAEEFREKLPALAEILRSSEVSITAQQYEERDRDAVAAQAEFRRVFNRANKTVLITAILIALVLAMGILDTLLADFPSRMLLLALSIAGAIFGALASKDLNVIRKGKLLEEWMSKRALAETTRLEYFYIIAKSSMAVTNGIPLELLKLEYFRRFQLDVQSAYYRQRAKDHQAEARKTLSNSSWAIAAAAVATSIAGILSTVDAQFSVIATLGTIFTAFSYFSAIREEVYQNRRNGERYARTAQALDDINKRLDNVRRAVLLTGQQPLIDFIEAVHEQLSLEHRQWIGEQSESMGAFARLEETLKNVSSTGISGAKNDAAKGKT